MVFAWRALTLLLAVGPAAVGQLPGSGAVSDERQQHGPGMNPLGGHCRTRQSLRSRRGAGPLADSELGVPGEVENVSEVVWVGPECLEVHAGSPSLHKLGDGQGWLFSHDLASPYLWLRGLNATVHIFHSYDRVHWSLRSNVSRIYWANLFGHGGDVYLLGTHGDDRPVVSAPHTDERKGGPVTISKSTDQVNRTATHRQDFVATPSLVDSCDSHSPARLC